MPEKPLNLIRRYQSQRAGADEVYVLLEDVADALKPLVELVGVLRKRADTMVVTD